MTTFGGILGRSVAGYWRRHLPALVLLFVLSLSTRLLTALLPVALGKGFDLLLGYHTFRARILDSLPAGLWESWDRFFFFFIGLLTLKWASDFLFQGLSGVVGESISHQVRSQLFESQLQIPLQEYQAKGAGKYLLRWSGDLSSIRNWIIKGMVVAAGDLLWIVLLFVLIGSWFPNMAPLLVGGLLCWLGLQVMLVFRSKDLAARQRDEKSILLASLTRRLSSMMTVLGLNRQSPERQRMMRRMDRVRRLGKAYAWNVATASSIGALWPYPLILAFLFQADDAIAANQVTTLLATVLLLMTATPAFRRLSRVPLLWQLGTLSQRKLELLQQARPEPLPAFRFQQGSGHYRDGQRSYAWEGGSIHFVTMASGAGKSTMIRRLMGLDSGGDCAWDGQQVDQLDSHSLRKTQAVISPDFPLLGKTVFEAVAYSRKEEARTQTEQMLTRFFTGCPANWTPAPGDGIGDQGALLSLSQRQLLLYVRALLTRKPILLIEHPALGLDPVLAAWAMERLLSLTRAKTILVLGSEADKALLEKVCGQQQQPLRLVEAGQICGRR